MSKRITDPIEAKAVELAIAELKQRLRSGGFIIKHVGETQIRAAAKRLVLQDPEWLNKAKQQLSSEAR